MKTLQELQLIILEWANDKDLLKSENAPKQRLKLLEEVGETAGAILKNKPDEIKDGIGDIFIVLVILCNQIAVDIKFEKGAFNHNDLQYNLFTLLDLCTENETADCIDWLDDICINLNLDLTECANLAWNEIKDRTGKNVGGTFIKD